jgi:predicted methyltransferase
MKPRKQEAEPVEGENVEQPKDLKQKPPAGGSDMRREEVKDGKRVRQVLFFIIVGTNGTGKTTLTKQLINTHKTLVVDPDGLEWSQLPTIEIDEITRLRANKHARIIAPEYKEIVELVNYRNGNLVLDDCRYYVKSRIEEGVRQLLVRRRQKDVDIFAVAHSLNEVPPTFWTFATHLVLFKIKDNPQRLKQNIPKYKELTEKHIPEINSHQDHHYFRVIPL